MAMLLNDAIVVTIAREDADKAATWAENRARSAGRAACEARALGLEIRETFLSIVDGLFCEAAEPPMLMVALEFGDGAVACDFIADGVRHKGQLNGDRTLSSAFDAAQNRRRTPDGCTRLRLRMAH